MREGIVDSEPERARRTLSGGVLAFRWVAYVWMTGLNLARDEPFRRPALAWLGLAAAGLWTIWLTVHRDDHLQYRPLTLQFDLGLSMALILISGLVVQPGRVTGPSLFYATAYPASSALAWGAAYGLKGAAVATVGLGTALLFSRPLNGIQLNELGRKGALSFLNGLVTYMLAGGIAGVVSRHLDRSAAELRSAIDASIRARERTARIAEREAMGRAIHDSVLQALARVCSRGRELARQALVAGSDVMQLAEMAGEQEKALRALIVREQEEIPLGAASLRDALEAAGRAIQDLPVTVASVGPLVLPAALVEELVSAVRQALANVVEHAQATRVAVFADSEEGWVHVSVRDDGRGFVYDEKQLQAEGKAGMLRSMKGRVEDLGGKMRVETAPGAGTEVQFRIPAKLEEVTT
jgi:signal transduction histidine kinase